MNQWDKIWAGRSSEIAISEDIFDMFCKLKKADGFDTQDVEGYYEAFFSEWNRMTDDLKCEEADQIVEDPMYDIVLADSVFQYFQSTGYGMSVLEKMWKKAKKSVVITEIHDEEMKEEHLQYRRQCVENYDEKYRGLDKTFYTRDMFLKFAERVGARCELDKPQNDLYWNNKYVFDCYLIK